MTLATSRATPARAADLRLCAGGLSGSTPGQKNFPLARGQNRVAFSLQKISRIKQPEGGECRCRHR